MSDSGINKTAFGIIKNHLAYYSAKWLADQRLHSLPATKQGIYNLAKRENWDFEKVPGQGTKDGVMYFRLPDYVRWLLEQKGIGENSVPPGVELSHGIKAASADEPMAEAPNALYIERYDNAVGATAADQDDVAVILNVAVDQSEWQKHVGDSAKSIKVALGRGDSMHPTIKHGESVLIDISVQSFIDEAIYVIRQNGLLRFKRIILRLDGKIEVKTDNPNYAPAQPEVYSFDEYRHFDVIGRVIPLKFGLFNT